MKKILCSLAMVVILTSLTSAQQLSAEVIVQKYVEIIGGAEAWKNINTMRMTGESQNSGMTLPVTIIAMRPNYQRVDVDIQGQKYIDAFDGETAWTLNPFMGGLDPVRKTEDETKEAAKQMFEDEFIDYKEKGHVIKYEGEEEIQGAITYKVKLVKMNGDEMLYYFDAESYVPILIRSYMPFGPMKGKAIDTFVSDYEEVGGVIMPFYMEQKMDGQVFLNMKTTKVEFNVPLQREAFMMPKK